MTWNPLDKSPQVTLAGGNLIASKNGVNGYAGVRATAGRPADNPGGFYFEVVITTSVIAPFISVGVANASQVMDNFIGSGAGGWSYYQETGEKITAGAGSAYGAAFQQGDVIGVLLKNGKVYFRRNGVWQNSGDVDAETGCAFSGLTGELFPAAAMYAGGHHVITGRFSVLAFSGSIPSGAAAWGG